MRTRDGTEYDPAVDLREAVATRARISGDLVLVDDFLNHRVEPALIASLGREVAAMLRPHRPDIVLTAEASGISVGVVAAIELDVPLVYAKKYLGPGNRYSYSREVASPTKGIEYRVEVARRALPPGNRVAIVDDFLSGGRTANALGEITEEAGSEVVGCVFAIEKSFYPGRERLEAKGWSVDAVVRITGIDGDTVLLA